MKIKIATSMFLALSLTVAALVPQQAGATLAGFNPSEIMSDSVMANNKTMSVKKIQSFLKSKNTCNNSDLSWLDSKTSTKGKWKDPKSGITYQYNLKNGKFVCMANDKFDGGTAAQIIYNAAQDFRINPQVIIVLLQKEQALITDTFPNHIQYRSATGYGCPDTAACDKQYYGLNNQVRRAAKLFRDVLNGGWSNYPAGSKMYVQYNPNSKCGGKTITIKNRATSALYRYTPYQPNKAALNAGWGESACGAYGNRNFYNYFTSWFGSTRFQPMNEARELRLEKSLRKTNLRTGTADGAVLQKGMEIYFTSRYEYNGELYVRTKADTKKGIERGIRYADLTNSLGIRPMSAPRHMILTKDTRKTNLRTGKADGAVLTGGMKIYYTDRYTYKGELYLRTQSDTKSWLERGVRYTDLTYPLKFDPMKKPRNLSTTSSLRKTNLHTQKADGATLSKGTKIYFSTSYVYKNELYVRTKADTVKQLDRGIRYADLRSTKQ